MSNRQVSRITQALHLKELDELNHVESEEEEEPVKTKTTFAFDNDTSESEEEVEVEDEPVVFEKAPILSTTISNPRKEPDDMAFLEEMISKNDEQQVENCPDSHPQTPFYFITDPKELDLDKVLNDKFSRNNFMRQVELQEGGKKKPANNGVTKGVMRKNLLASHRNYLFGAPKEDWSKPPSFIGGGMQLVRSADPLQPHLNNFTVQWSSEYKRANELYQLIQNTGDVNRLVMFLANYPYHIEGLLQLSMVFARLGLMDRSSDLVRRCLFCFECSFSDSFKPYSGLCRMNPSTRENGFFFQALFKHLQHCYTLGCHQLTVDLCRLMLSLDPSDRSHSLLLTLDYYLLQAGSYEQLQSFANSVTSDGVVELTDFTAYEWSQPYHIGSSEVDGGSFASTIADLPNWWYSVALSHYLSELETQRKQSYTAGGSSNSSNSCGPSKRVSFVVASSTSRHAVSSFMLKCALYQYPFMLSPLLSSAGVTVGMFANSTWKPVLNHAYFSNAMNSLPASSYLRTISIIYSHRVGALWNTPETHVWILEAAKDVIARIDRDGITGHCSLHYRRLSASGALTHYTSAKIEDFTEEVVRMPNELNNLIDPQLMDPRILAGGVRFTAEQMGVELPRANRPRMNRYEKEQREQRQREERSQYLDLTMPLMELLFASLIPWYRLPGTVAVR